MKKNKWIIAFLLIGILFFLSSIPGLKVLPVLKQFNVILLKFDISIVKLSKWIASRLPLSRNDLHPLETIGRDFYSYARANPIIIEFFLRKIAHITIFFFITIALFSLTNQYVKKPWIAVILSYIGGSAMAFADEYRQTFVAGRVGSMTDVFIDMVGVTFGIFLVLFSLFITKKSKASS